MGATLFESVFIESARLLFWWYVVSGVVLVSVATLAWAGDLGVEGARLRHGIGSPLSCILGLPRVALCYGGPLVFLILRRLLLALGAYGLTLGVRAVGATFRRDEQLLLVGVVLLGLGLALGLILPLLRRRFSPLDAQLLREVLDREAL